MNDTTTVQPIKFIETPEVYTKEFIEWKLATDFPQVPPAVKTFILEEYYKKEHPCTYNNFQSEPFYHHGKRMWGMGWESIVESFEDRFGDEHMAALEYFIGE